MSIPFTKLALIGASVLTAASCVPIEPAPYGYGSTGPSVHYIERIPSHYRSIHYQGRRYFHNDGVYYEQRGARYYRVPNPHAHDRRHDRHPSPRYAAPRYEPIRINNRVYYRSQNDWYERRGVNYIRISDPRRHDYRDDRRSRQPHYRPVNIRGREYYTADGEYFIIRNGAYIRTRPPGR